MKKIDLHIHTVSTISDKPFVFSLNALIRYVEENNIDAIAITNHNLFDIKQFIEIRDSLSIKVFPGIEVDVENGHLLVISEDDNIEAFSKKCEIVFERNGKSNTASISETDFVSIFKDLSLYLLIPHYDKKPELSINRIPNIKEYITAGEVSSDKKFISLKNRNEIIPVYFSDLRISEDLSTDIERQTYIDIEELSLSAIKYALTNSSNVSLTTKDGNRLFEVLDNGLKISTGLTVILGKRSSGKSYTMDRINEQVQGGCYIKQFSLLANSEDVLEKELKNREASIDEEFLKPFKDIVDEVRHIDLNNDSNQIDYYLEELKKAAQEAERQDVYSRCILFHEAPFSSVNLSSLDKTITALDVLLETTEYKDIIYRHVSRRDLIELDIELREKYISDTKRNLKLDYINDIINNIKRELKMYSTNTSIPDIDFYNLLMNVEKINKFTFVSNLIKNSGIISEKNFHAYNVVTKVIPISGASILQKISRTKIMFSDAYEKYDNPYDYLQCLKKKPELPITDYYRYFVQIKHEVHNQYGTLASGGELSEFNLLQKISSAIKSSILILDEPESSFDNIFLKDGVNVMLKEISKQIPVVISTHNNTIGASVHPDYLVYTEKKISPDGEITYHLYSGYPSSQILTDLAGNEISRKDVMLNCLEAGEPAYHDRRKSYDIFINN